MHLLERNAAGKKHVNLKLPGEELRDKIHSISYKRKIDGTYRIACAAGREVLFVDIIDNRFQNGSILKVSDWIKSIKLIGDDDSTVIVSAHNVAALIGFDNTKPVIKEKLRCDENSTLYCSFIYGETWNQLLFFGGTA